MTLAFSKFYKRGQLERLELLRDYASLSDREFELLKNTGALSFDQANRIIENVIGTLPLPLGIATNFYVNRREYIIPMAVEEPSIVAAASNLAGIIKKNGGFQASSDKPMMIGQIQLVNLKNIEDTIVRIDTFKEMLIKIANEQNKILTELGGGLKDIEFRRLETDCGDMLIVHLLIDVQDSMGGNAVNSINEALGPIIEEITGGTVVLKILSNLSVHRKARASAVIKAMDLEEAVDGYMKGDEIVKRFLYAYHFAKSDPFRAATHNKGIMNGIDSVLIATGNDFRAIEAGAHAYASLNGHYTSLTKFEADELGNLICSIELPLGAGTVGGSMNTHPVYQISRKILKVYSAKELCEVLACVGLAQNTAALLALTTRGIQHGHMKLHAKNIAVIAGVPDNQVDIIASKMIEDNSIRVETAKKIYTELSQY